MHTPSHFASARCAGLMRAMRRAKAATAERLAILQTVEVVLPSDYEGDENVGVTDVINGQIKGARLKVAGKVTARAKVASLYNEVNAANADERKVVADCTMKLRSLGVDPS